MIRAIFLTFIITALGALVMIFYFTIRNQAADKRRLIKENENLKRQNEEYFSKEQRHRECAAYDRGLYDGRTTDTFYRQCLEKFRNRDNQVEVMMNGETEEVTNV